MDQRINKDELVRLLRDGLVDEFNQARPYLPDIKLDLCECDFRDIKISGADLTKVDLSGCDFSKSEIENADFKESDLSSVNFSHSTISESNFSEVMLEGSFFNHSVLVKNDFSATDLTGINICGADLTGTDLSLCKNLMQSLYDGETIWPDDELLPEDFDPQYEMSFAELEEESDFNEDQYSY